MYQQSAARFTPMPHRKKKQSPCRESGASQRTPVDPSPSLPPNRPVIRIDPSLTIEQHRAVMEALELAQDGMLFGCDCYAEGRHMPCEHVMEAADDPAIAVIRSMERRTGGPGVHVLMMAGDYLADQADPEDEAGYRPSRRPTTKTDTDPGTFEKKQVIRKRIVNGESVGRDGDKRLKVIENNPVTEESEQWNEDD